VAIDIDCRRAIVLHRRRCAVAYIMNIAWRRMLHNGLEYFRITGVYSQPTDCQKMNSGSIAGDAHTADGNNFRSTFLLNNSGTLDAPYTLSIFGATLLLILSAPLVVLRL
jgi:hypothetical protein